MNPHAIYERLVKEGEAWAEAEYSASLFEETTRVLKSKLMQQSPESSMAAKETDAYASKDYEEHVKRAAELRCEANKAKVRWISAQAWVDASRTQAASERAALKTAT